MNIKAKLGTCHKNSFNGISHRANPYSNYVLCLKKYEGISRGTAVVVYKYFVIPIV